MPPKGKVERSPHFNEIVDLLLDGWSGYKVSDYLKEQYDEDISFNTLNRYRKKHLDVELSVEMEFQKKKREAKEKATAEAIKRQVAKKTEAQNSFERAVAKGVDTRSLLTEIISHGSDVLAQVMADEDIGADTKLKLILQAAKEEREWTKNDDTVVNVENNIGSLFDEDLIRETVERKREKYG